MSTVNQTAVTSPELVLMQMMIENDEAQSQADKAARESAREVQRQAMQDELEAIQDQADAIRNGALVQGGLQIAGGGLTVTGTALEATPDPERSVWLVPSLQTGGDVATGLAQPAGKLFGDLPQTDAQHDAKAASQEQEQASWVAEDAESHRQKLEKHAETLMQQVQGIVETQHQTTVAVIANI